MSQLEALQSEIVRQKALIPFEMLGRSLAYNPYLPRFRQLYPTLESKSAHLINAFHFDRLQNIITLKKRDYHS